ncbi:unnamed protein product [Schistosoma margrebowiei]|uniref:Uncharacterized protein n=1 Tax=Schistosoma margrebowiei TaxID=48269 RepID=A0A3P7YRH0_9TREM|nr:unnamed protein product [Schistosoma margrebowiei]
MGLVSWMCLHLTVDVHFGWLAVEYRTRVSSYLRLVSWLHLHFGVDVHYETRN